MVKLVRWNLTQFLNFTHDDNKNMVKPVICNGKLTTEINSTVCEMCSYTVQRVPRGMESWGIEGEQLIQVKLQAPPSRLPARNYHQTTHVHAMRSTNYLTFPAAVYSLIQSTFACKQLYEMFNKTALLGLSFVSANQSCQGPENIR
jgi:hypothetical protein